MTQTEGGAAPEPMDSPQVTVATEFESDAAPAPEAVLATAPEVLANSLAEYARLWLRRVRGGESGALPVVVGLIVLLVGEIDLSVGYNAALGGVITLWLLSLSHPLPLWLAVPAGLAFSGAYAGVQAVIITRLSLPSFVVTLAGYLGGLGLLLFLLNAAAPGSGGTIRVTNNILYDIDNPGTGGSLSPVVGWIVMAAAVALAAAFMIIRDTRRRANSLAAPPASVTILKIVLMAAVGVVVVLIGNANRGSALVVLRGVPWVVVVVVVLVVAWTVLLGRTRFGRYVYAIGGNAEAARRAGINLSRIRVTAFVLTGLTAG